MEKRPCINFVALQIEHGKGLGKDGVSIKSLREKGYESIFIGIGKLILWRVCTVHDTR